MPSDPPSVGSAREYHPDGAQADHFDKPLFEAALVPYRSLGQTGFRILMAVLISCWAFVGLVFLKMGAWPIFGFFGLDVVLIYLAFRWNYHAARAREEISVSRSQLHIRQFTASGKMHEHRLNPFWTHFKVIRKTDIGIVAMQLESKERSIAIGSFLNPDDRESFATAFGAALAQAHGR